MASPYALRVGLPVTVSLRGRHRPGVVTAIGPTWVDVECDDGEQPSGYRIPKEDFV